MKKQNVPNQKKSSKFSLIAALILWDILTTCISAYISINLTFSGLVKVPTYYLTFLPYFMIGMTFVVLISNTICGCYNRVLKYIGFNDILRQGLAVIIDLAAMFIADWGIQLFRINILHRATDQGFMKPATYIIMALLLITFSVIGRGFWRFVISTKATFSTAKSKLNPIIIYGAGEAGSYFLKKTAMHPEMKMRVVAFIDDDKSLQGMKINGVQVVGGFDKLEDTIRNHSAYQVVIAIPTAPHSLITEVVDICKKCRCQVKRFGTIDNADDVEKMKVSEINLEDLLHRERVHLNMDVVKDFIHDKVVLVTGGAGSIGSEICRQVLKFNCKKLVIFDIHENGLFDIDNELKQIYTEGKFEVRLGSIRDRNRLTEVFNEFNPSIVFHAAAHKHVPMMEINPREAIKNNVMGTINTCQAAIMHNVEKFILISTDKAVNPTNIMGASKRITELVIQMMDKLSSTEFAAVRFGNVLGSNGSVVPFFRKQIANGGPVTVTDPEMRRYFMTIPEAVQLVLEAGSMAKGGEIFVLDMGQPVYIKDLAIDLIRLSGYEPDVDIKIVYTGLRPGEKLFEEISLADEDVDKTSNRKITIMKPINYDEHFIAKTIKEIEDAVANEDSLEMFRLVQVLVPTFNHKK